MRPSLIVIVLYVGAVVVGAAYLLSRPDATDVVLEAGRPLPEGHLVGTGDLSLRPNGRQYLPRALAAGEDIAARELLHDPAPAVAEGMVPLAVTVERASTGSGGIEAGSELLVCPGSLAARVRAVFCAPGAQTCLSVVEIVASDAEGIGETAALSLREGCW